MINVPNREGMKDSASFFSEYANINPFKISSLHVLREYISKAAESFARGVQELVGVVTDDLECAYVAAVRDNPDGDKAMLAGIVMEDSYSPRARVLAFEGLPKKSQRTFYDFLRH
ncbi:MAG: hypothetical protein U9O94_09285 [Nanoarchaeota archaeon]|nr:hypothetical protein [Nanoarchaeota archaeon]